MMAPSALRGAFMRAARQPQPLSSVARAELDGSILVPASIVFEPPSSRAAPPPAPLFVPPELAVLPRPAEPALFVPALFTAPPVAARPPAPPLDGVAPASAPASAPLDGEQPTGSFVSSVPSGRTP